MLMDHRYLVFLGAGFLAFWFAQSLRAGAVL